jgi:GPI-anchor transamidase subunit T
MSVVVAALVLGLGAAVAEYVEEVVIKPLEGANAVYSHFQFTNRVPAAHAQQRHFDDFPQSVAQLVTRFHIEEWHVSFTQGRWQTRLWGLPLASAPVGAELTVWFRSDDPATVDQLWRGFTNALSGITCASLQFMLPTVVAEPRSSFAATSSSSSSSSRLSVRRGALPREMVCTENLTPWLKLLPCGADGLAHLLNPLKLYDGAYHSQATHVRHVCADGAAECAAPLLELTQTIGVVQSTAASRDWSLQQLFGRSARRCPVAAHSNIFVMLRDDADAKTLEPAPDALLPVSRFRFGEQAAGFATVARFDARSLVDLQHRAVGEPQPHVVRRVADIAIYRSATGDDQLRFEVARGADADAGADDGAAVPFVWFDALPWQMRIFLHTLQCSVNGRAVSLASGDWFTSVRFEPSDDRVSPTVIELRGALRRNESLVCTAHFQRAFMAWTEFPPDAHRGYDMGAAVLEVERSGASAGQPLSWSPSLPAAQQARGVRRLYTPGFQIILPTPDFSMPYNVICLTGTVWALYFGNLFNTLVRRYGQLRDGDDFVSDRPLPRLLRWLRAKWTARTAAAKHD